MSRGTPSPSVDLVVLDVAGTTIQEHGAVYTALVDAVMAAGALPGRRHLQRWMGADKHQAVAALLRAEDDEAPPVHPAHLALVEQTYQDFRRRLAQAYRDRPPTPFEGTEQTLRALRSHGVKIALATGFTRDITTSLLATVGWDHTVLDAVVTMDDVTAGRPAPYMVFRAMELTGTTDVTRVLVAGDTIRDLESGTNAGARFVV
jgi:phosphonatase-like hydrolase